MYDGQRVKCVRGLCADYARNMPKLKNQRSIFLRLHRLHRCFNELHTGLTDVSMSFTDASQTLHRRFTGAHNRLHRGFTDVSMNFTDASQVLTIGFTEASQMFQ